MEYVRLGKSGLKVSRLCLGMQSFGNPGWQDWVLDERQALPIVAAAAEAGINFFDTSNQYSEGLSEVVTGSLLRGIFSNREEYVVATKVYNPMGPGVNDAGLSRKHILAAVEASLRRLGTDYIDLYQLHRWDYKTPIEETLATLDGLVISGKVRYLGASSMWCWQLQSAVYATKAGNLEPLVSMQNHFNLMYREEEREVIPYLRHEGIACLPWSPLARGELARVYDGLGGTASGSSRIQSDPLVRERYEDIDERTRSMHESVKADLRAVSEQLGTPSSEVALAWLLHQECVTAPVVGVGSVSQLHQAVRSLSIGLDDELLNLLNRSYYPQPVVGHD